MKTIHQSVHLSKTSDKGKVSTTIISVAPVATMVLAAIGVVAFIVWAVTLTQRLGPNVFNLTYQFLLLTVIGGAVSWVFTQHSKIQEEKQKVKEKQQESKAEEKVLLRKLYSNIVQAYNAAKRARRLLRATARCFSSDQNDHNAIMITVEPYEKQMQVLIDIQLQFETFIDEVESNPNLFSGNVGLDTLINNLSSIEKYLNGIVDEYEDLYKMDPNATPTLPLSKLTKLGEFIGPYGSANYFKTKFKAPAHQVMEALLHLLTSE